MVKLKYLIKEIENDEMDSFHGAMTMQAIHRQKLLRDINTFTKQYITTALWSSTDDRGQPLNRHYSESSIELKTLETMIKDCKDFQKKYGDLYGEGGWDDRLAAHDFWLTRNGHGAGFLSRDEHELQPTDTLQSGGPYAIHHIAEQLTQAAKSYGGFDLYLERGMIYGHRG